MRRAHTVEEIRAAEAALMATLPEGALMERASTGLAHHVADLLGSCYGRTVRLLVGSGDNGGDALHAGAVLARRGCRVEVRALSESPHPAGLAALRAAGGRVLEAGEAGRRPDLVLDAIVGIGGRPGLRADAVAALAEVAGVPVVAVDVPSGVGVDTGELPDGGGTHVTADVTVTFGTHRVCHLVDPAAAAAGAVHVVGLGGPSGDLALPPSAVTALQAADVARLVPRPGGADHKYSRGVVGVRAGSARYPGAGLLCVAGAASGLAGMVRYVGDDVVGDRVRSQHPEVVGAGRVQAWAVGSGTDAGARRTLQEARADDVPLVVDADALAHVTDFGGPLASAVVLTPHAGELATMLDVSRGEVEARPLASARRAAETFGAVVLLKGRRTLVADRDGDVRVSASGTPWLATAGAGDVLTGLVGALLAAGLTPYDAASVGAWLHGSAATLASSGGPLVAGEVARAIPAAVRALTPGAARG
ncbi:NAD(P)H-hydrate dehydratase [Nocardioides sp. CFH 31398]|uniref:NAD(P)H-hydrate dehydratase n=1 Tax=Nocardioides sp. CFH 31398 TaxID=2919579 RepID=UPI001F0679F0|nr:NAD(P)H-hydrate dehydratase [Nocardioides sp. CFH 31398]MCH1866255.1 NAD(P)H-hydrate dehydratase [Nocardioides sp. CFH 31398]